MRSKGGFFSAILLIVGAAWCEADDSGELGRVARTEHFVFYSDRRMSLHHFLYMWATSESSERVQRPHAVPMPDKAAVDGLSPTERETWEKGVEHYQRAVAGRSLLFDRSLLALKTWLRDGGEITRAVKALVERLRSVEPVYARTWWPTHDAKNRAWAADVLPHLKRLERELCPQLAQIFGGSWPARPVRIDLVAHSNEQGAYSTSEPHVTISTAPDKTQLPSSLELVFHEPCHGETLQGAIERAMAAAEKRTGLKAPHDLWHVLLFQTTGLLVQEYWHANGEPEYRRMIDDIVLRVKRWEAPLAALDRYWTPVIRSRGEGRAEALDAILRELAAAPSR